MQKTSCRHASKLPKQGSFWVGAEAFEVTDNRALPLPSSCPFPDMLIKRRPYSYNLALRAPSTPVLNNQLLRKALLIKSPPSFDSVNKEPDYLNACKIDQFSTDDVNNKTRFPKDYISTTKKDPFKIKNNNINDHEEGGGSNSIFVHGHPIFGKCTCTKCTKCTKTVLSCLEVPWKDLLAVANSQ